MAITRASTFVSTIPIKRSKFIGNTLVTINSTFRILQEELVNIINDKIPDPLQLTYEVKTSLVPPIVYDASVVTRTAIKGNVLAFDPYTLNWVPSAVPGYESSIASAWVVFRAPVGMPGDPVYPLSALICSNYNVKEVKHINKGHYVVSFKTPLKSSAYAVFGTGVYGGTQGTTKRAPVMCRYLNENQFEVKWYVGSLPYGSVISAVVFSSNG